MKILTLFFSFIIFQSTFAQTYNLQSFATGFTAPVEITHAGDSRLFVVQQNGIIKIVQPNGTVNATNFLNISSKITYGGESGLLGLAFHPQYSTNGKFFVYYNAVTTGNITVARYSVSATDPNVANVSSEEVLLSIPKPYANHNGGSIHFAPDGNLWISTGDGGGSGDPQNNSQNINSLLGKLLRINVDGVTGYTVPSDNPFAGAIAGSDEIWSFGLRNAWKFSFDVPAGNIMIADVGQNLYEEINRVPINQSGVNYGWRCYEANTGYSLSGCAASSTMTFPVATYDHSGGKCSITGGYVYRGSANPTLTGLYFFADYCSDQIGVMTPSNTITWSTTFSGVSFTTFGRDYQNELYVGSTSNGTVYKITTPTMATSENMMSDGIEIYPNPTSDLLQVKGLQGKDIKIEIYDMEGRLVLNSTLDRDQRLNVSSLKSGVYIVTIKSGLQKVFTKKIIKK